MTRLLVTLSAALVAGSAAFAEPQHGIAMYGDPALPNGFEHLPYANPDAPTGGEMVFGETGGFDSLNPYIIKGRSPWGVRAHVVESLMGRNWDEPFTLYGLLAESIETGPNREWVEFTLNPAAQFSDGSPVTVEDVVWSMETLAEKGRPNFRSSWEKVESWEQTSERSVRFNLAGGDLELPLILALRPILKKADWDGLDFAESTTRPLIASGPYVIGDFDVNRYIEFTRDPAYWGKDLPFNTGRHNLDTIRYDFFGDAAAVWQAFTAGETSIFREGNITKWRDEYTFGRAERGEVLQSVVPHQRPSGMEGFVFNTRRDIFSDWRVREALILAFNFEWINDRLNESAYPRITSYFANSQLAYDGTPEGAELALLEQHTDHLFPGTLEGYALPVSNGDIRNRGNLRRATALLADAGWTIQNGALMNADGQPFTFEIMLRSSAREAIANIYADALTRLGIEVEINLIDSAQYTDRRNAYDYDMMVNRWSLSLSPGNEQRFYWGADGVDTPGTRNYMGVDSPAVDAMIDAILTSTTNEDFVAATRALDRTLTAGRYTIPFWFIPVSRIAHDSKLTYPETLPIYGDWIGFMPDVWWSVSSE